MARLGIVRSTQPPARSWENTSGLPVSPAWSGNRGGVAEQPQSSSPDWPSDRVAVMISGRAGRVSPPSAGSTPQITTGRSGGTRDLVSVAIASRDVSGRRRQPGRKGMSRTWRLVRLMVRRRAGQVKPSTEPDHRQVAVRRPVLVDPFPTIVNR